MNQNANPFSASEPWNLVADGYAETTMIVFEQFADEAIAASKLKPNSTLFDVACGPGTLVLRLAHHAGQVHGIDFSAAMLAIFNKKIEQAGHRNIALHCGDTLTNDWDMLREMNPAKMPKFDAVVANPPFSYRWEPTEALGEDKHNDFLKELGLPPLP